VNEGTQLGDGYAGGGGTLFLKCRGGGKLLAQKWAGGWKKRGGNESFLYTRGGNEKHLL
jgi:hypothetical protein